MLLISKKVGYMSVVDKRYLCFSGGSDRSWNWINVDRLNTALSMLNLKGSASMFDNSSKMLGNHYDRQYVIERNEKGIQFNCQMLPWPAVDKILEWLDKEGVKIITLTR